MCYFIIVDDQVQVYIVELHISQGSVDGLYGGLSLISLNGSEARNRQ